LISFDGDQTLYSDGGNFAPNADLAKAIIELMKAGVTVAVITAAGITLSIIIAPMLMTSIQFIVFFHIMFGILGYGNDGEKYAVRLRGLLDSFIHYNLTPDELSRFYIFGGECNYLLQACYISSPRGVIKICLNYSYLMHGFYAS
jgi:IMP and pyridine-specific 5'-nucleotidase